MVRHILGISGGKDSAALAIYLKNKYPQMKLEYYIILIQAVNWQRQNY